MKRRLLLLLLLALVVLSAACGGSGFDGAILGAWEGISTVDGTATLTTWEFFEDGTMIITPMTPLGDAAPYTGTYAFEDDDTITLHGDGDEGEPGRRDIQMPDDNTLILTAPVSGAQAVLKRVEE